MNPLKYPPSQQRKALLALLGCIVLARLDVDLAYLKEALAVATAFGVFAVENK